jgi:hypothetical protein
MGGSEHNAFRVFRYFGTLVGSSTNRPFQPTHVVRETLSLFKTPAAQCFNCLFVGT